MDGPSAITGRRLIFVGGLHRSGTTPLARALAAHPDVSGLRGTGVPEDEGQHLQRVYPTVRDHGGMGRFARSPGAHLTESSPLAVPASAERLLAAWTPYWELDRPLLLEKSPANLIMGRFLQAVFPGSALVVVARHPVVAALALAKWNPLVVARNGRRRTTLYGRVEHWVQAYSLYAADEPALDRTLLVHYEDLVAEPRRELANVQHLLGLARPVPHKGLRPDRSTAYQEQWRAMATGNPVQRAVRRRIVDRFGDDLLRWGYDIEDLGRRPARV